MARLPARRAPARPLSTSEPCNRYGRLECERLLHTENRVRAAVRTGMAPLAAYEKFGVFQQEGRGP